MEQRTESRVVCEKRQQNKKQVFHLQKKEQKKRFLLPINQKRTKQRLYLCALLNLLNIKRHVPLKVRKGNQQHLSEVLQIERENKEDIETFRDAWEERPGKKRRNA